MEYVTCNMYVDAKIQQILVLILVRQRIIFKKATSHILPFQFIFNILFPGNNRYYVVCVLLLCMASVHLNFEYAVQWRMSFHQIKKPGRFFRANIIIDLCRTPRTADRLKIIASLTQPET